MQPIATTLKWLITIINLKNKKMANIEITDQGGGGGGGSGTVTSVGLTTGTTGTNVNVSNSPITTSGSIVLNIPTASATNTGKLSNTDWTTFNNKGSVSSVGLSTGTTGSDVNVSGSPVTTSGSITLNIPTASGTNTGKLSNTDWTTFNNKFTLPALTAGSVLFSNGTTIAQDNANLFWNDSTNHLGIGTNAPSGLLHVDGGANIPRMILDADTNVARIFSFRTNDTQRWAFRIDDNETGSNAGSNFHIRRYNDAGTFIDAPISIARDTGLTTISKGLSLNGSALTNFVPNLPSTSVNLTITSANSASYNGAILSVSLAVTITIDNTVPQGFTMTMIQQDANQATIAAGTGLTLRNRQGHTKTAGQWAVVSVAVTSTNLILGGDTAA